jgi:hypothetical protein
LEASKAGGDLHAAAIEVLASTPLALESVVGRLPQWLLEQPIDDGWSPKDVIVHLLISQERGSFSRIRAIVGDDLPDLPNIDERQELEASDFFA